MGDFPAEPSRWDAARKTVTKLQAPSGAAPLPEASAVKRREL
jgi:hypothetical protein